MRHFPASEQESGTMDRTGEAFAIRTGLHARENADGQTQREAGPPTSTRAGRHMAGAPATSLVR